MKQLIDLRRQVVALAKSALPVRTLCLNDFKLASIMALAMEFDSNGPWVADFDNCVAVVRACFLEGGAWFDELLFAGDSGPNIGLDSMEWRCSSVVFFLPSDETLGCCLSRASVNEVFNKDSRWRESRAFNGSGGCITDATDFHLDPELPFMVTRKSKVQALQRM